MFMLLIQHNMMVLCKFIGYCRLHERNEQKTVFNNLKLSIVHFGKQYWSKEPTHVWRNGRPTSDSFDHMAYNIKIMH